MSNVVGMDALQRRLRSLGDFEGLLRDIQLDAMKEAKDLVPRKTANLARTIRPGALSKDSAMVKAGGTTQVGYAAYVELGTRPHEIRPRNAKVLAWGGPRRLSGKLRKGATATNFARVVRHPGTKPRPYLFPGARRAVAKSAIAVRIISNWNRAA